MRDGFLKVSDAAIQWCIYTIIFAAPFAKSLSEIAITLAIVLWCARKVITGDYRIPDTGINIPLAIFIVSALPSLFVTGYPLLSTKALFTKLIKFVMLVVIVADSVDDRQKVRRLCAAGVLTMTVIFIDAMIQYHWLGVDLLHSYPAFKARRVTLHPMYVGDFYKGFPTGSFPFPNDLAAWILLVLFPLASVTMFGMKKSALRLYTAVLSSALFYLFFLTKARGAWIGLAISTVYVAIVKKKVWLIGLLILMLAVPFILKMEMARYIFESVSVGDRFFMWETSWRIFQAHPVIGNGLNTFFMNFMKYRNDQWKNEKGSYAHNCYIQMASDTGIIGLASFLWLMGAYFLAVFRGLARIADRFDNALLLGLSIGVFAFLVHSFFDTNLYSLNLATLFWCAVGITLAVVKVGQNRTA